MDTSKLLLSAMRALWGVLTPNVRKVFVSEQNNIISFYFCYNDEPSEIEIELSEDAASELIANFHESYTVNCERHIVKFPSLIENHGLLIYSRFE